MHLFLTFHHLHCHRRGGGGSFGRSVVRTTKSTTTLLLGLFLILVQFYDSNNSNMLASQLQLQRRQQVLGRLLPVNQARQSRCVPLVVSAFSSLPRLYHHRKMQPSIESSIFQTAPPFQRLPAYTFSSSTSTQRWMSSDSTEGGSLGTLEEPTNAEKEAIKAAREARKYVWLQISDNSYIHGVYFVGF